MQEIFGRRRASAPSAHGATGLKASATGDLGHLPEWNLGDLYSGMDAPELKHDLARAAARCA